MRPRRLRDHGFSLLELLVVLVIMGILAVVTVSMIGDRRGSSVRSVLDEIEGTLYAAQKSTIGSSRDVFVSTAGDWVAGTLVLDGRPLRPPPATANPPNAADLAPDVDSKRVGAASEVFRARPAADRDHMSAGVAVSNAPWYGLALGTATGIEATAPVSAQVDFVSAMANPLFVNAQKTVVLNGQNKRFMTGFSVVVVGLVDGIPVPNGPVGVLIVPQNSSTIYKYYKADQSSVWRKL